MASPLTVKMVYELYDTYHGSPYPNIHVYGSQGVCAFVECGEIDFKSVPIRDVYQASFELPRNLLNS